MENTRPDQYLKSIVGIIAVLVCLSLLVAGCAQTAPAQNPSPQGEPQAPQVNPDVQDVDMQRDDTKTPTEKTDDQAMQLMADGTYTDEVTYKRPEGSETIEIKLTVEKDVIKDIAITAISKPHQISAKMINAVNTNLPSLVVGKKISEISLPKNIGGSSLTSGAVRQYLSTVADKY